MRSERGRLIKPCHCSEGLIVSEQAVRQRLAPQTGAAFLLREGMRLRVIDPEGEQVADLAAFIPGEQEWLSSGRSIDYNSSVRLTAGHTLYSNRSRRMLTIVADTVGRHDFLFAPCSPEMFAAFYGFDATHPSCFRNLADNLRSFGINEDLIPTTFNVFMNVDILPNGELKILPPASGSGDYIEFSAETDLIIGLTACSAELSNNWRFKPIEFQITPP
jgi:uncharacterized protein YcgI (DUF1989 family)